MSDQKGSFNWGCLFVIPAAYVLYLVFNPEPQVSKFARDCMNERNNAYQASAPNGFTERMPDDVMAGIAAYCARAESAIINSQE